MDQAETKICQNCKQEFIIEPDDFAFYEKMKVPPPTFCPECRLQRRMAWKEERSLYRRKCDLCGSSIIAMYPEETPFPVYCMRCWESDKWDAISYGQEYDFSKSFFDQSKELYDKIPHKALMGIHPTWINSEYNNNGHDFKNCYLMFNSDHDEDCMYGTEVERSTDCIDMLMAESSRLSYESIDATKNYKTFFSISCDNCRDVWFSRELVNCADCFGCINLRNKKYYIFNQPYSKEEYEKEFAKMETGSYASVRDFIKKSNDLFQKHPRRYMHGTHNTDISGEYISHSKNVKDSYIVNESENCRYCMWLLTKFSKDCYDYSQFGENASKIYEALICGVGVNDIKFSLYCVEECRSLSYCSNCHSSSDLFGCFGLRKKQYCILNKQYTKEEYEVLVPKIIEHMSTMPYVDRGGRVYKYGEFFPTELSPYAYNESDAQEFFSLSKEKIVEERYQWLDFDEKAHLPTLSWENLPDNINDVSDTITNEVILCKAWESASESAMQHKCTKAFKITKQELDFYRRMNLPLPRECPNTRHSLRLKKRNPIKLWSRKCAKCGKEIETSYAPDRPEIVYCEQCYQQEVV